MADPAELPEPDRIEGAPHPRETHRLIGHEDAEAGFLDAFTSQRLHHAWMISGPEGVGKATLAWKIARFLRANPPADPNDMFGAPPAPTSLDTPEDHPVFRQALALAEPGIFLLRRGANDKGDRLSAALRVQEVRRMRAFFSLSVVDGGRRVVIVDSADEMNNEAANALLKSLEEPPAGTIFLLISHTPSRLLPTIRSRCRELRVGPLSPDLLGEALAQAGTDPGGDAEALGELARGSVGRALTLAHLDGLATYREIVQVFMGAPRYDRAAAIRLANSATGAANVARYGLIIDLLSQFLARLARAGAGHIPTVPLSPDEPALLARLSPNLHASQAWARLEQDLSARAAHGRAVNLDPAALILDMVFKINETAAKRAA
ncbi:MAG: DNA polymerase III subunit delta' [Maritimibacter sp.]